MEEEIVRWKQAGMIAAKALQFGKKLIKPEIRLLDVAEQVEQKIIDLGAKPAFPVNISMNQIAAHYTPLPNDDSVFKDELVKLDVGAHVDGYIGDTACTIDLSNTHQELVKASQEALDAAIKVIRTGTELWEIGQAIRDAINKYELAPIKNLSGHGLARYELHAPPSTPNFNSNNKEKLTENQVVAIEPFATNGIGKIQETDNASIFSQISEKNTRNRISREILKEISTYDGFPFATRWLTKKFPEFKVRFALKQLLNEDILKDHTPLPEINKGLVSQAEHSMIVKDKPIITTRPDD